MIADLLIGGIKMLNLYFKNIIYTKTTISILFLLFYILFLFVKRNSINHWGIFIAGLVVLGLWVCTYAATRDGLHLTIQKAIDGTTEQGLFSLISLPTVIGALLAAVIIVSAIVSIFTHTLSARKMIFFIMSGAIGGKIVVMEISRIVMYITSSSTWFIK